MKQVGNTILAKGVNHILAKRDNSAWPKGSKLSGFSSIHCRKATTKPQSVKGAFLRMLTMNLKRLKAGWDENYLSQLLRDNNF